MANPGVRVGLLAAIVAPIIWAAHFNAIYVLNALACARGIAAGWVPAGVAVLTAPAALGVAWLGWLAWRRARLGDEAAEPFLNRFGLLICALTLLAVAWNVLPVLLVPACGGEAR